MQQCNNDSSINIESHDMQSCNQIINSSGGRSFIQGELNCTQDASQHNKGGGFVYNNNSHMCISYQTMKQQSQMLCSSNHFTMTAVDHCLDTRSTSDWYNATLKFNYYVHTVNLTIYGASQSRFYYVRSTDVLALVNCFIVTWLLMLSYKLCTSKIC